MPALADLSAYFTSPSLRPVRTGPDPGLGWLLCVNAAQTGADLKSGSASTKATCELTTVILTGPDRETYKKHWSAHFVLRLRCIWSVQSISRPSVGLFPACVHAQ